MIVDAMSFGANLSTSVTTQLPALANTRFLVVGDNRNEKIFQNFLIGFECLFFWRRCSC